MSNATVLSAASRQWSTRPVDQRFKSLESLHEAVQHHRDVAIEAHNVNLKELRFEPRVLEGSVAEPVLIGKTGTEARFTHHGFRQLSARVGAPAAYLSTLPAELACVNLNYGISTLRDDEATNDSFLFAKNGALRLRAALSSSYRRIWNADITSRLLRLSVEQPEWQPAPAAFDGSRGLYASDSDMFAFLVDNNRRIFEKGPEGGLSRGFFVSNSEVGTGAFAITTFFYEYVCGNHRVWGARDIAELRIRHVGDADDRAFEELSIELTKYAGASAKDDEARIQRAQMKVLGESKDAVLDAVFGLRVNGLSRKMIEASYEVAEKHEDWYGSPRTVWGLTGGMTQVARDLPNANDRVALERASGKILSMNF